MNDMIWDAGEDQPEALDAKGVSGGAGDAVEVDKAGNLKPVELDIDAGLAIAEGLFLSYAADLEKHKRALEAEQRGNIDPARLKAATSTAKAVKEAIAILMTERNRVDKLRKDIAGDVGGGSLDLDAARDEIGRRLACLRRADRG